MFKKFIRHFVGQLQNKFQRKFRYPFQRQSTIAVTSINTAAINTAAINTAAIIITVTTAAATAVSLVLASCATRELAPAERATAVASRDIGIASNGIKGIELGDLNHKVDACTDFYAFANGTWRDQNPIPAGKPSWSRRISARDANKQRIQRIFDEASRVSRPMKKGSSEQLIGDHYASCMNEAAINTAGLAPLAPLLDKIEAAQNMAEVQHVIRELHALAIQVPFAINSATDYHAPANTIANIAAGGLGLADRDYYLKPAQNFADARLKYRAHIVNVLTLGGMQNIPAGEAADNIVALEMRLAEASLDSATAGEQAKTDHKMSFAQLKQSAPNFDWEKYFDDAKLPKVDLNIAEPKFMAQLDKEFKETPVANWKVYLKWHLLDSASPWLSSPFVEESFNFRDKYLGKATAMKPRAERCAESVDALLGEALGKQYVDRYFSPTAKAKVQEIARNLLATLKENVGTVSWMGSETKRKAIEKLADTNLQIGYPDQWKDYSSLTIYSDARSHPFWSNTFWANIAAARKFNVDEDRQQIGKPTNRSLWALAPSSAGAYLDLQLNKLVLPAGFLQPPFFNVDASDAVNYGALGIGLAHDLTHAIDANGSETDIAGRPHKWWADSDRKAFDQRAQCIVDQYEGYEIERGAHHDGNGVLSEAIGDQGGVRVAYQALEKSMQQHPVPVIDGFTPEQQFFISWGQNTGAAMAIEAQRQYIKSDPHPTPQFRVIGPLSNAPEFQRAFACKTDAAMVRPPEKRCTIW